MSQWEHRYLGQERDQRALEFGDAGEYSQYHAAGRMVVSAQGSE